MKHVQKGFTLIEIMIVVAIIAILAAVAIPNFISYRKTSQKNACLANQKAIIAAQEAYAMKNGAYTSNPRDLVTGGFLKNTPYCPLDVNKTGYTLDSANNTVTCGSGPTDEEYKHVLIDTEDSSSSGGEGGSDSGS